VPALFAHMFDDMNFISEQLLCHWSQMQVPGWCDDIINFSKKKAKIGCARTRSSVVFFGGHGQLLGHVALHVVAHGNPSPMTPVGSIISCQLICQ